MVSAEQLAAIYALESVRGFGPVKFRLLHELRITPDDLLSQPNRLPITGKLGEKLQTALKAVSRATISECRARADKQLLAVKKANGSLVAYGDPCYPPIVFRSNEPVPILYVRGERSILGDRSTVAVVGSRKIRPPYSERQADFVKVACQAGFTIVSGFALGADTIGHRTAYEIDGRTICVMPCGLDRPFPPENKSLWDSLLNYAGAAFVSQFPFGFGASALSLRKRNKLIVACSLGVLVGQSSKTGGAMNAYRFALEQRKRVATFESDNVADSSGNAQISEDPKVGGTAFPAEEFSSREYLAWLRGLSSLT